MTATTPSDRNLPGTGRVSFARIREPLEVPDLLSLQVDSFDWLIGNEHWQARVDAAKADGRDDVPLKSGMEEVFEEIGEIQDNQGNMSLSFKDHHFEPPKASVDECREKDLTYAAPLFVTATFENRTTDVSMSQTVFMGDYPLMTDKGTFIINGTERVVVSQLVRSPGMSDDLIRDQILTMLIAGHDTSTALLAWVLYLLGVHPATLTELQAEVDSVLGAQDEPPTADQLNELTLLDQVIKETLRLYPPIHIGNRHATEDMIVCGYHVPEGTRVMYSIYLSHRDKEYWEDPDAFCSARFARGAEEKTPPFTYLPFGGGPRNCIGAAFAQVEARTVLARLLQRFDLELLNGDQIHPHMGATLEPRPGGSMRVKRRK